GDIKPRPRATLPAISRDVKARKAKADLQKALLQTRVTPAKRSELTSIIPPPPAIPAPSVFDHPLAIGFYINWDESSYASLERNLDHLDWIVPQWVHLQNSAGDANPIGVELDPAALDLIR